MVNKAARKIRHATIRSIAKNLGYSYLGFRLTSAQLRAGARTLYYRHIAGQKIRRVAVFHWDTNNAHCTPAPAEVTE